MEIDISTLVSKLKGELSENAYKASDSLGRIGTEEVVSAMLDLLNNPNPESKILASRTLGLVENNSNALEPLLEAVKNKGNSEIAGDLLMALEDFNVSDKYVELFRLYLFGTFKLSMVAKNLLDFKEFDITPRVLKKAQKHWDHYTNNVKHDELFELRKIEVKAMLDDLRVFLEEN